MRDDPIRTPGDISDDLVYTNVKKRVTLTSEL